MAQGSTRYNLYTKSIGDSPDVWVLVKSNIAGEEDVLSEVLELLDKRATFVSFSIERTA